MTDVIKCETHLYEQRLSHTVTLWLPSPGYFSQAALRATLPVPRVDFGLASSTSGGETYFWWSTSCLSPCLCNPTWLLCRVLTCLTLSLQRLALTGKGVGKIFGRGTSWRWLLQGGVHPWLERLKVRPGVRKKPFFLSFVSPCFFLPLEPDFEGLHLVGSLCVPSFSSQVF